jgi:stearoyl-CoA desaturase (delta-9 desaturase)
LIYALRVRRSWRRNAVTTARAALMMQFRFRHYPPIMLTLCFILPTVVPVYVWNETWFISIFSVLVRYIYILNGTFSVNSVAHIWGSRPYNRYAPLSWAHICVVVIGIGQHNIRIVIRYK